MNEDIIKIQKQTESVLSVMSLLQELPSILTLSSVETGQFFYASDEYLKITGYTMEEMIGKTSKEIGLFSHHEDRQRILSEIEMQGCASNLEISLVGKNGQVIFALLSAKIIKIDNSSFLLVMLTDITSLKITMEKLESAENRFRLIWESSKDGNRITDENGTIIMVNNAYCQLMGKSSKELLQQPYNIVYITTDSFAQLASYKKNFAERKSNYEMHSIATLWNGKKAFYEVSNSYIEFEAGKVLMLSIFRDETERFRNEKIKEALYKISVVASTSEDLNALYEEIHNIIKDLMPADNFYIAIYDEIAKLVSFPYLRDEYDSPPPPRPLKKGLTEYVLRTEKPCLINKRKDLFLRKKGEVELIGEPAAIWLGVPLKLEGKSIGVIVLQDYVNRKAYGETEKNILVFISEQIAHAITKVKSADALKKYAEELRMLNINKDKLFSIVSHDLRSPFNSMLAISEILADEVETLSKEELKNFSSKLHLQLKNQYNFLVNLLDWAQLQTGGLKFVSGVANVEKIVDKVTLLLEGNATSKKINLYHDIADDIEVICDENMFRAVLHNLVSNAIKFTRSGGNITIRAFVSEKYVEISVTDTGIGMPPNIVASLFKIESSHSTPGTSNEKGTGLGLILCKELVEKQGGNITVRSEVGKGTTIAFQIPIGK